MFSSSSCIRWRGVRVGASQILFGLHGTKLTEVIFFFLSISTFSKFPLSPQLHIFHRNDDTFSEFNLHFKNVTTSFKLSVSLEKRLWSSCFIYICMQYSGLPVWQTHVVLLDADVRAGNCQLPGGALLRERLQ